MLTSIIDGLLTAVKRPKLVALLWAWYALLSLIPTLPALAWLKSALDFNPAAAVILRRFDFGLLRELSNYDQSNVLGLLTMALLGTALVALASSAFVIGGTLGTLGDADESRTFMHRFSRGGGHFFWRFFRLALTAGVFLLLSVGVVAGVLTAVTRPLADSAWEPMGYLVGAGVAVVVALVAALFLLALDYARVRVARDDCHGMLRTYFGSIGFVIRHAAATYGMGIIIVVLLSGVMLLYVAYETNAPAASTSGLILLVFVLQQIAVAARVFLRVSLLGAERSYFRRIAPAAAQAAATRVEREPSTSVDSRLAEHVESDVEGQAGPAQASS